MLELKDKIPYKKVQKSNGLEYGKVVIEMHEDTIQKQNKVLRLLILTF